MNDIEQTIKNKVNNINLVNLTSEIHAYRAAKWLLHIVIVQQGLHKLSKYISTNTSRWPKKQIGRPKARDHQLTNTRWMDHSCLSAGNVHIHHPGCFKESYVIKYDSLFQKPSGIGTKTQW